MTEEEAYRLKHAAAYEERERERVRDVAKHMKAFEAAARKLDRAILQIASGEEGVKFPFEALQNRRNKPEIRGDDAARAAADARISDIRARWIEAKELGRVARSEARHAESRKIQSDLRDRELDRGEYSRGIMLLGMLAGRGKR